MRSARHRRKEAESRELVELKQLVPETPMTRKEDGESHHWERRRDVPKWGKTIMRIRSVCRRFLLRSTRRIVAKSERVHVQLGKPPLAMRRIRLRIQFEMQVVLRCHGRVDDGKNVRKTRVIGEAHILTHRWAIILLDLKSAHTLVDGDDHVDQIILVGLSIKKQLDFFVLARGAALAIVRTISIEVGETYVELLRIVENQRAVVVEKM